MTNTLCISYNLCTDHIRLPCKLNPPVPLPQTGSSKTSCCLRTSDPPPHHTQEGDRTGSIILAQVMTAESEEQAGSCVLSSLYLRAPLLLLVHCLVPLGSQWTAVITDSAKDGLKAAFSKDRRLGIIRIFSVSRLNYRKACNSYFPISAKVMACPACHIDWEDE